jgi:hypothetical protein
VRKVLQAWQGNPELAGVRDGKALAQLPESERRAWQQFWADVDAVLAKVQAEQ